MSESGQQASFRICGGTSALPPIPDVPLRHSAQPALADDGDRRSSSGSLAMLAAIGAPRCCGFLATPANISRFDVATGLTHLGSEVDHDWALAGG
jgi:hypothetical protein